MSMAEDFLKEISEGRDTSRMTVRKYRNKHGMWSVAVSFLPPPELSQPKEEH